MSVTKELKNQLDTTYYFIVSDTTTPIITSWRLFAVVGV